MVYYSERLHVESRGARRPISSRDGAIGRVVQVIGLGPHRLEAPSRPAWFFERATYGGILCDIGSHQFEQFLFYTGRDRRDASSQRRRRQLRATPTTPSSRTSAKPTWSRDNGATNYIRVDWLTPDGLSTWGDGRTFILGTKGYIELRKYVDVAAERTGDHLFLVDEKGEHHVQLAGQVGFPFFGQLILDCLNRTENAMTQAHAFKAAELCLLAQARAMRVFG